MLPVKSGFIQDVKSFIDNHKTLCILTLGIAVVGYSIGNFAGRCVSQMVELFETTKKTDHIGRATIIQKTESNSNHTTQPMKKGRATQQAQQNSQVHSPQQVQTKWDPEWNIRSGTTVGPLGNQWKFNSDHIPVGGVIKNHTVTVKIASFNVLNTAYINHIYGNDQGLKGSDITENNKDSSIKGLSVRDVENLNTVLQMVDPHGSGMDYIALQECSEQFEAKLKKQLPKNFEVVSSGTGIDRQLYVYNKIKLAPVGKPKIQPIGNEVNKKITQMIFKDKHNQEYCFVGVHLPGGPKGQAARKELGEYLARNQDASRITIVLGDMNSKTIEVGSSIETAFNNPSKPSSFNYLTKGSPTHVNTKREAQDYDSIHISVPNGVTYYENKPEVVLRGLDNQTKLLH